MGFETHTDRALPDRALGLHCIISQTEGHVRTSRLKFWLRGIT